MFHVHVSLWLQAGSSIMMAPGNIMHPNYNATSCISFRNGDGGEVLPSLIRHEMPGISRIIT
jgi:hypothetical protein